MKGSLFSLPALVILITVATSLLCRYQWLPFYPFHEDGVATIGYIEAIAAGEVSFAQLISQRSPLGHALLALPLFFVESSVYSYRLTNLVFFAGVLVLLVLIGRQTGQLWAGIMAMVFVAFSSLEGLFVGFVRFYLVFQFFFLLVWYLNGQYFFLKKKHAGYWLFLACLLTLFVHKLALQFFVVTGIAFVTSGSWAAKSRLFWLFAIITACFSFYYLIGSNWTLAPSDFNETTIGDVGSVFSAGQSGVFYNYFKIYVPLGWSFLLCSVLMSFAKRDGLLAQYCIGFLSLFFMTSLLAPGDSPHYVSHLFPVGVFCGMSGLTLCAETLRQAIIDHNRMKQLSVLLTPLLVVGLMLSAGFDTFNMHNIFGKSLTFLDERPPHVALKRHLTKGDVVLSTNPVLTRFYLGDDNVLLLRQRVEEDGTFSAYNRTDGPNLVDSIGKLNLLLDKAERWVWIYGNKKYQRTVGPKMSQVIDRYVKKVVYYNEEQSIFIVGLKK